MKAALGVLETVSVTEVVDEALRDWPAAPIEPAAASTVERDYQPLPPVRLDRHKLFETLTNLLSNARHGAGGPARASAASPCGSRASGRRPLRRSRSRTPAAASRPRTWRSIFTFGFTTRAGGHGFGLHASALAAAEMGGRLTADSDGPGRGARFVLELPCDPPAGYTGSSSDSLEIRVASHDAGAAP